MRINIKSWIKFQHRVSAPHSINSELTQTSNSKWKEENSKPVHIRPLGHLLIMVNKFFFSKLGLTLVRIKHGSQENTNQYLNFRITDSKLIRERNQRIAQKIGGFLTDLHITQDAESIIKSIEEFDNVIKNSPVRNFVGGFSYNNALSLFIFVRALRPNSLIESGVWRGFTTYILRSAAPNALLNCFDVDLGNKLYTDSTANYFEYDLEKWQYIKSDLLFCDDHVSQDSRLQFAFEKKIPYLVFDDDLSDFSIHSDGWPAFPTISQIRDIGKGTRNLTWIYDGKSRHGSYSGDECNEILNSYNYALSPLLFDLTGYIDSTRTSFLTKKF